MGGCLRCGEIGRWLVEGAYGIENFGEVKVGG
jgi:hypothetical protein